MKHKIFAVAVISVAFLLCSLAFGEADHYKMAIQEKGTPFSEDIDIDETQDVEVFRVPAHNDVEGADFYHDFKLRLSVTRVPSRKVCYISEMDSSLSSPGKLKMDLDRAASQQGNLPVTTKSTLVIVKGPANRLLLTKDILDFCGSLPIYHTEHYDNSTTGNDESVVVPRRQKRLVIDEFKSCLQTQGRNMFEYVNAGGCNTPALEHTWQIRCKLMHSRRSCFYYVTCTQRIQSYDYYCSTVHRSSQSPICCDYRCP